MTKDITGFYSDNFKSWEPKLVGPKPAAKDLDIIHKLGARPGKQALANAMALRPNGVTGSEIVIACGAPQLNKMRGFIADGLLKREAVPPRNGHTVYKLTLTPKGQNKINGTKSTTVKKTRKAKAKTTTPVVTPAPVVTAEVA